MDTIKQFSFKYEQKALAEHERMSRLFRENRFLFELERQKAIEKIINRVKRKKLKKQLQMRQARWDKLLRNSGTVQNRLVLIQMMLWDAVNTEWLPAIEKA